MQKLDTPLKLAWQRLYRFYGVRKNVTVGVNVHIGMGSILASVHGFLWETTHTSASTARWNAMGDWKWRHVGEQRRLDRRYDHDFRTIGKTIRESPWIAIPITAAQARD